MILSFKTNSFFFILLSVVILFSSCTEEKFLFAFNRVKVKDYPDTAFVYSNKVNVKGATSKDEKTRLQENLANYWADSLLARRIQKFGIIYSLQDPPIFDTAALSTTNGFMNSYLFSQGYFNAHISDSFHIDTVHKSNKPVQYRTNIFVNINVRNRTKIDSLKYNLGDTLLQRITINNAKSSKIEPGKTPFSKEDIGNELDRLITLYRNRGYYLIRRDNVAAVVDTADASLLKFTADPFEQIQLLQESEKRKENPTASVTVEQRRFADTAFANSDTSFLKRFYTARSYFYPETRIEEFPDSILNHPDLYSKRNYRNYSVYYRQGVFVPQIFRQFNYMPSGRAYSDEQFYKTVNALNQAGSWKQVDTRILMHGDSLDVYYFLYPDKKQNITYNLEASRNTGDILSSSNFFGVALNITYRNRNVWKRAVQSSTSFTNGVELGFNNTSPQSNSILQAFQISLGQTYSFPKAFIPFKLNMGKLDFGRTIIGANVSYADRRNFFRLRSFVADYGYDWKKKNKIWRFRFPNIELYSLDTLPSLIQAFNQSPFLRNSFNTGRVVSMSGSLTFTYTGRPNVTNYVRFATELCIPGLNKLDSRMYQFVKAEAEYRKTITLHKTAVALRALAGLGYNYYVSPNLGVTLPFYKQYIAGGPNSMRAWGLRQLGLGSSLLSDTSTTFTDRYGDMQLEANIEYRYAIAHFSSLNLNGAVFADAGNIWNVRRDPKNPGSQFDLRNLGSDVAVAVGTGLRLDFNFFLIRIDFGIKLKDPARISNNGWLDIQHFTWRNHELDNLTAAKRNNYAVQLGIGLPF